MIKVLDSYALLAFLDREPGHEIVEALFLEAVESQTKIMMTAVNYGEVYYIVLKELGQSKAQELEQVVSKLPLKVVEADWALARQAARIKAHKKMAYADCFAAALAKKHRGEVVTGDPEFKEIEEDIKVRWLR
jgi:predicted nucleic acid-binding protein